MLDLAWQIVRDGEGATKFITVEVTGAESPHSARRIARTIAESPGVKAALGGETADWGRVVAAVGDCAEPVRRERLSVRFGDLAVVADGAVAPGYRERGAARLCETRTRSGSPSRPASGAAPPRYGPVI